MDNSGAFSIDYTAAYTIVIIMVACVFFTAMNTISVKFTGMAASELQPIAENLGDMLVKSDGSPPYWHTDPSSAHGASIIGLSSGKPNIISKDKVHALSFLNASEIRSALGLDDKDDRFGILIEVRSGDNTVFTQAGYPLRPDIKNVYKSTRIVAIEDGDGIYRDGDVTLYVWREHVGTEAADVR